MNRAEKGIILLSTFSDEQSARELSKKALEQRLCACVNYTKIRSLYLWKGKQEDQEEVLALFKTTKTRLRELKKAILENHPYEVPEVIELQMTDVSKSYLSWLVSETLPNSIAQKRHNSAKRRNA